ncbi:hypothetical protein Thpro_020411 [Acidihalobacter prosperus]|uniref:Uncharacterized protein n=1 Tax=Acidihalobacter prosperus TaxID=160660 RepID=A0A1A6C819_9GAMM|nr:hypothetical protein Thpro_020411 [Acidihalobacter prosperus]
MPARQIYDQIAWNHALLSSSRMADSSGRRTLRARRSLRLWPGCGLS